MIEPKEPIIDDAPFLFPSTGEGSGTSSNWTHKSASPTFDPSELSSEDDERFFMNWEYIYDHFKPVPLKMLAYNALRIQPLPDSEDSDADENIKKFLVIGTMRNDQPMHGIKLFV